MSVLKYFSEMDDEVAERARRILRKGLATVENTMTDDDSADVVIEQVWNALVGFPTADEDEPAPSTQAGKAGE